ncbi:MAG TPA: ribosome maturation factor RimM [Candidatus Saccharimonadales bacterium]|nr:ribosome maturation factor RimM [Candidatus Saccharimonadales bacterium]
MSPPREGTVLLAEIDRPRGLKGEVVATLHADDPERLDAVGRVWLVRGGDSGERREARLEGWKRRGDRVVLKLTGVDTVEEARALAGAEIRIDASESPRRAPEGRWFAHQLEGLSVVTTAGVRIGEVVRVLSPSGQALLEVRGPRGECLVPLVPAICVRVDPEAGVIEVDPPEGLLDLNGV